MVTASTHSLHPRHASSSTGTFFSLFHKRRHPSTLSLPKKSLTTLTGKSIQNEQSENILNKIRMSSLASVASSMNIPSQRKGDILGRRQERRTGRRNDKFLSLWHDYNTPAEVICFQNHIIMQCSYNQNPIILWNSWEEIGSIHAPQNM